MEGAKISTRALDGVRFEDEEGIVRYNTIWHKNVDGIVWESYEGITEDQFQTNEQTTADRGFYLVFLDGFSVTDTATGKLVPRSMSSARFLMMKNSAVRLRHSWPRQSAISRAFQRDGIAGM